MSKYIEGHAVDPALFSGDDVIVVVEQATGRDTYSTISLLRSLLDTLPVVGGTANGVLFLNGGKVVSSGSALTFTGAGGFQLSSGAGNGEVAVASTSGTTKLESRQDISYARVTSSNFLLDLATLSNQPILFTINSLEQMRLTSTGLGIGTSSPRSKLDVTGTTGITWAAAGTSLGLVTVGTQGSGGSLLVNTPSVNSSYASGLGIDGTYDSGTGKSLIRLRAFGANSGGPYTSDLAFSTTVGTTETERMRLDSAGNLGLGVTPSASWSSGCRVFQFGSFSAVNENFGGYPEISFNSTQTGSTSFVYRAGTNPATRFSQTTGAFQWFIAPSGTAGNAISFTQAMTLHASGGLSVGNTSDPGAGSVNTGVGAANSNNYVIRLSAGTSGLSRFIAADTSDAGYIDYEHSSDSWIFRTGGTERARIPAAGGMVVGTAALATTATDGFLYVPTCAGTPTGTPTTQTGTAPIVVDTTNNKLYFYSGGQWRDAGP